MYIAQATARLNVRRYSRRMPRRATFSVEVAPHALRRHPRFGAFVRALAHVPGLPRSLRAAVALTWLEHDPPGMRALQDGWDRGFRKGVQRLGVLAAKGGLLGACIHYHLMRTLRDPDGATWILAIPRRNRWHAVPPSKRSATLHVWLAAGPAPTKHVTRRERFIHALSDLLRAAPVDALRATDARFNVIVAVLRATHGTLRSPAGLKADVALARSVDPARGGIAWPDATGKAGRRKRGSADLIYEDRIRYIVADHVRHANALLAYDAVVPFAHPPSKK